MFRQLLSWKKSSHQSDDNGAGVPNRPLRFSLLPAFYAVVSVTLFILLFTDWSLGFASGDRVEFDVTDDPASWFRNTDGPIGGSQSLAITNPGDEVKFSGRSNTVHTITSLIFPTGASDMPFDTEPIKGSASLELDTPGLYVFVCKIHPYMFGAVINDDPKTDGLDLGESITLINDITVPTSSDLATRLLRTFFIATNPDNWQDYTSSLPWRVTYPDVDVRITDGAVVNLRDVLNARYGNDIPLAPLADPETPAVGEIWVDTQFELTDDKDEPGTVTVLDGDTWQQTRKIALPDIEMNNPHNMWTDRQQRLVYITQWFDSKMAVVRRDTGALVDNLSTDESPAHVMTSPATDNLYVTMNGEDEPRSVVEITPDGDERDIDIGRGAPHGHWLSHDGQTLVTPNVFSDDSTIYDLERDRVRAIVPTGSHPLAIGMMPDDSKYYVANLLDSTLTVIDTASGDVLSTINLLANYDPISGDIAGPVGGLPIQTPVSPDGRYAVTANTLTASITIIDTDTDSVVAMLPCDPGCHGVQFGAKQGGGYYAYVSSKFSNRLIVVDADPNEDGDASDAIVAGTISLVAPDGTPSDDVIVGLAGMGGQGILPIPVVYNGWVQNLPSEWKDLLTPEQQNPYP